MLELTIKSQQNYDHLDHPVCRAAAATATILQIYVLHPTSFHTFPIPLLIHRLIPRAAVRVGNGVTGIKFDCYEPMKTKQLLNEN